MQQPLPDGTRLNQYTIVKTLGGGGFGVTYLAVEDETSRKVAIKELFPYGLVRDTHSPSVRPPQTEGSGWTPEDFAKLKEDFVREAQILIGIKHRQIVPVLSFFAANNTYYLVMEYIAGKTWLSYSLEHGPLAWEEAVRLLERLAVPIRFLHENEPPIFHRDLNPKNVLLQPQKDGSLLPIVIDFGLAREGATMTKGPKAFVYDGYAPLEQYPDIPGQPRTFGPESDVYSMAALAYRLLAGEDPKAANLRVLGAELPAPHMQVPTVPKGLSDTVMKGLSIKLGDRPKSVAAFQTLLPAPREGESGSGDGRRNSFPRRLLLGAGVVSLAGAGIWAGKLLGNGNNGSGGASPMPGSTPTPPPASPATPEPEPTPTPIPSPSPTPKPKPKISPSPLPRTNISSTNKIPMSFLNTIIDRLRNFIDRNYEDRDSGISIKMVEYASRYNANLKTVLYEIIDMVGDNPDKEKKNCNFLIWKQYGMASEATIDEGQVGRIDKNSQVGSLIEELILKYVKANTEKNDYDKWKIEWDKLPSYDPTTDGL